MKDGKFFETIANPDTMISVQSPPKEELIPSKRLMKTVGYIFGYILSILLLFCAKMLVENKVDMSALSGSGAALVAFTALVSLVIELPKKTAKNLFIAISALIIDILALFTYCGNAITEHNKDISNFFSEYGLCFNVVLIVLGIGIGVFYYCSKEND